MVNNSVPGISDKDRGSPVKSSGIMSSELGTNNNSIKGNALSLVDMEAKRYEE